MKTIYFYEMSNINDTPYVITNPDSFYDMCKNWGIKMTKTNKMFIESHSDVYAICKPGKSELVLSGDYKNLRKNFNKAKNRM